MSFFKNLFGSKKATAPQMKFGRYSDTIKTQRNNESWDKAMEYFNKKEYMTSYEYVLEYLSDENLGNLTFERNNDIIRFTMLQGSKKIEGLINQDGFYAEAKMAHCNEMDIALMRTLLEENYHLKYTSFALDTNDNVTAIFQSDHLDASPYKLYYGLEELALKSDNNDDFFIKRFESLSSINMDHTFPEDQKVKAAKYRFWKIKITDVIDIIENGALDRIKYPGAMAYLILSTLYAFDYLIKPEGEIMKMIEQAHLLFFDTKNASPENKNMKMLDILKKMESIDEDDFNDELYATIKTFGVGKPGNHNRLNELIDSELKQMDWYYENGHKDFALSIPSYIVGNILYTYSLPKVDRALLQIYYEVIESELFKNLNFVPLVDGSGKINRRRLLSRINKVIHEMGNFYKEIRVDFDLIETENILMFAKSYLVMMRQLSVKK